MKKTYIVPNTTMVVVEEKNCILANSDVTVLSAGNGEDALSNEDNGWDNEDDNTTWKW